MVKKKSNQEWKKEGEEVKAIFSAARTKEHNCAVMLCAEGMVIEADPRLPPENLKKKAKKRDGATTKGVMAKLNVNGSSIEFTLLEDPPGGFEKKFKQYLLKIGVKMKPNFIQLEEKAEEDKEKAPATEAQDEAETSKKVGVRGFGVSTNEAVTDRTAPIAQMASAMEEEEEQPQPVQEPELSKEQLTKDITHVIEIFKLSFEGMDEIQAKKIKGALKAIAGEIKGGDLVLAQASLDKLGLQTGVTPKSPLRSITIESKTSAKDEGVADLAATMNQKKELTKSFADLKPELLRSMQIANPEHKAELQKLIQAFGKEMKSNSMKASQATFDSFKSQIESFDVRRAEGRAKRKLQFGDIQIRAEEIVQRLEQLAAQRGGA